MDQLVQCPKCDGKGSSTGFLCGRRQGHSYTEQRTSPCRECNGSRTVTTTRLAAIQNGERCRDDRVKRGLSQREEAERLGITPQALNDIEHAKVR